MDTAYPLKALTHEQDRHIAETVSRERGRLRRFIRQRVADPGDAEDILQEVFYEMTAAYRLPDPIEQISAWLYRVALNRITDLFRKKRPELLDDVLSRADEELALEDYLPSADAGPEAAFARGVLLQEVYNALNELAPEQRAVFLAHEIEGHSFEDISTATGVGVNTLLSRKRYAVRQLRRRLQAIHDEFADN